MMSGAGEKVDREPERLRWVEELGLGLQPHTLAQQQLDMVTSINPFPVPVPSNLDLKKQGIVSLAPTQTLGEHWQLLPLSGRQGSISRLVEQR